MSKRKQEISIKADGRELDNQWTDIRVSHSLDDLCPWFEFHTTQKTPFKISEWPVRMGGECAITMMGELVMTGWIEDININYTETGHEAIIGGRAKTCDLVDCSRTKPPYQWSNPVPMLTIIKDLVDPFGITVKTEGSAAGQMQRTIQQYGVSAGTTIIDSILKLSKSAEVLANTTPEGALLFTTVGSLRASDVLKSGWNIKQGSLMQTNRERFSEYVAKGTGYGIDTKTLEDYASIPLSPVQDTRIKRYRPLSLVTETSTDRGMTETRAKWEAKYRAGNSRTLQYLVQGWQQAGGSLWRPNMLVKVDDNVADVHGEYLINAIEYTQSAKSPGTQAFIEICNKEKYVIGASLDSIKTKFDDSGGSASAELAKAGM